MKINLSKLKEKIKRLEQSIEVKTKWGDAALGHANYHLKRYADYIVEIETRKRELIKLRTMLNEWINIDEPPCST